MRNGTALQLNEVAAARRAAHWRFVSEALGTGPEMPRVQVGTLEAGDNLQRLWTTVRWENPNKEAFWRPSLDWIPLLGNSHMRRAVAAPCTRGTAVS